MKPADIPAVHRLLKKEYAKHRAPVVDFIAAQTNDPFRILITTILSARTKDETTTAATFRLFKLIQNLNDLRRLPEKTLAEAIYPVGFYRQKAKHLKALPEVIHQEFNGEIPRTIEGLCKLPGVGRKTANLVLAVAFNIPAVCVDVHVHRICNRFGLLKTETPFDTEMALRATLPRRYWIAWNALLVSFGQTTCRPQSPHCAECVINRYCDKIGVQS